MKKIFILLMAFVLSGCAYMVNGDIQTIKLNTSDNKKVKAIVKKSKADTAHTYTFTLPTEIKLKKSSDDIIVTTIGTECIVPTTMVISPKIDGVAWWNLATLGIGFIQDSKGAMWHYDDVYTINVNRDNACIKKAKELNNEIMNLHI